MSMKDWRGVGMALGLALAGWLLPAEAQTPVRGGRQFAPGALTRLEDLPPGRLRTQTDRLPAEARSRALAWLRSFHFSEHDLEALRADANGGIYYEDPAPPAGPVSGEAALPETSGAALPVSPFPASLHFHSRPGAPNVIYLNFGGETVVNTEWNTSLGRAEIPALAFSADADLTTFSDAEQLVIRRVWERVAEDYAPFNVDVTTERPAVFTTRTAHALITRHTDADGLDNPSAGSGGVAYVNLFANTGYARYRPAWIYHDNLGHEESFIAEATSHEIGHNLGLSHDGTTAGSAYYNGHGTGETSWGPLMGTGYNRNVSQWSKGEYADANNQQDDLATIAGKLTYRTDDHGGTAGSATPLVLTGGTNVVATTPADDPENLSPANKGVLERSTDVDVFSFVTGDGPVRLSVRPWTVPAGRTRGGNLDVRLRLLDELGNLLQAVGPADQTGAVLSTNLAAGRYFLQVLNDGAGDPMAGTPTGYTSYGSLGQYFIEGYVSPNTGVPLPPVAELAVADVTGPGEGAVTLTVTYSDDVAVHVATLDGRDLRVTGPGGFSQLARWVSVDGQTDGTPRVATYAVDPPAGEAWVPADNGSYEVSLEPQQVSDAAGNWAAPGRLGTFAVTVPDAFYAANLDTDPGWQLDPDWAYGTPAYGSSGPRSGYTGTRIIGYNLAGNYPNRLAARYATTPPINTAGSTSLTLRFRRWLRVQNGDAAAVEVSTNGTAWTRLWSTTRRVSDSSWQEVQYPLPDGFAGSPAVRVRWGLSSNTSQTEIGWNLDDIVLLGDGTLDAAPPAAVLSVADLTVGGSPSHACSVTFTDAAAVRLSSLGSADLTVTGPNGFAGTLEFTGADSPGDSPAITATYSIAAPGGTWDAADNGVYQLALVADEVEDIFNNSAPAMLLGSFVVNIPDSRQALVVDPVAVTVPEGGESSFTVRLAEAPAGPVTVTTVATGGDPSLSVQAGGTLEFTPADWSTPRPVTLRAAPDADTENGTALFECRSPGLLAVTVLATEKEPLPGVLETTLPGPATFSGPAGGPFSPAELTVTLFNSGGSRLEWSAEAGGWLTASPAGGALEPLAMTNVILRPGSAALTLPAGSFVQSFGLTNLTSGNGDTNGAVTLVVSEPARSRLTLSVNEPGWGSVAPTNGLYATGSTVELLALPAEYFTFAGWRGDVTAPENPLALVLDGDRAVEAVFAERLTTNRPTPLWWLAANGVADGFEEASLGTGANGLPRWQSYVAGLDPNDPASQLRLTGGLSPDGSAFVLRWNAVSNRVYSLWSAVASPAELAPLPGAQRLPGTVGSYTNMVVPGASSGLFQLRVELP